MLILLFALFFCLLIAAGVLIRVLSLPLFPLVHRRALILFALSFFCLLSILLFALYSFVCSLFFCSLSLSFLLHRTSLLRDEVRSNARALHCTHVFGYRESSTICKDVCVLSAIGTAVCLSKVRVHGCVSCVHASLCLLTVSSPPLSRSRDTAGGRRRAPRRTAASAPPASTSLTLRVRAKRGGTAAAAAPTAPCEFSCIYRYILRESCSQFDSLPLTSFTSPTAP